MPNLAKYTIEGTPSSPGGYDGTSGQVLHLALEGGAASLVQRWTVQVYDPADTSSPLASYGAPSLTVVGATSGQKVDAATPGSQVTITLPSGMNSWIVRSLVNGGLDANGNASPDYVWERMVVVRDGSGRRKTMASEATQYGPEGWARALNEHLASVPNAMGSGTLLGDKPEWDGGVWIKRRGWITPDIDPTGVTAADTVVQAALASATPGRCVMLPDGIIKKTTTWTIGSGVTLTGSPRGLNFGHRLFNSGEPYFGTLISETGTGVGFTMSGQQCSALNLTVYYPNQQVNAMPTVYDYLFDIPANSHGNTIGCISAVNPYRLARINADGAHLHDITGRPLNTGVWLKRCADVVRMRNLHLKGVNYAEGSTLTSYIAANATAFLMDGPEGASFTDCFCFGYFKGMQFYDADGDGFRGTDGKWTGGGMDSCGFCFLVSESQCLMLAGFTVTDAKFAPTQYGVRFDDSRTPSGSPTYIERPSMEFTNCQFHGTYDRPIWLTSGSHGVCRMTGGNVWGNANPFFREPSHTQAWLQLQGVGMPTGVTRTQAGAGNAVVDDNPISF